MRVKPQHLLLLSRISLWIKSVKDDVSAFRVEKALMDLAVHGWIMGYDSAVQRFFRPLVLSTREIFEREQANKALARLDAELSEVVLP